VDGFLAYRDAASTLANSRLEGEMEEHPISQRRRRWHPRQRRKGPKLFLHSYITLVTRVATLLKQQVLRTLPHDSDRPHPSQLAGK